MEQTNYNPGARNTMNFKKEHRAEDEFEKGTWNKRLSLPYLAQIGPRKTKSGYRDITQKGGILVFEMGILDITSQNWDIRYSFEAWDIKNWNWDIGPKKWEIEHLKLG